jgi:hypothetical protein
MEFRIKIDEKFNGGKRYTPQVGTSGLKIGKFTLLSLEWGNIFKQSVHFHTSRIMCESFSTEQEALDIIEEYKKYLIDQEGKEIKKTIYKTVK